MRKAAVTFGPCLVVVCFSACSSGTNEPALPSADASDANDAAVADVVAEDAATTDADAEADAAAPLTCDGAVICEDFETDPFASRWTQDVDPGGTMQWSTGGAPASPGHGIASIIPTSETRYISAVATRSFDVGPSGMVDLRVDVRFDSLIASKPVLAIASPSTSVALVIGPTSATTLRASLQVTTSSASTLTTTTLFPATAGQWLNVGISLDTTNATASASVPGGTALTADQVVFDATNLSVRVGVQDAEQPSTTKVTFDDVVVESP